MNEENSKVEWKINCISFVKKYFACFDSDERQIEGYAANISITASI